MKKITDEDVARKFLSLSTSAKHRGIEFDLSLLSVKNLLRAKRCYYTRVRFSGNPSSIHYKTIDRIDNTKGYIKGNVCACTLAFNKRKNDLTVEEIKTLYKRVVGRK